MIQRRYQIKTAMSKNRLGAFTLAIGMGLITPVGVVCAQAPTADIPAAPRFDIGRFAVDGNTLLKPEDIERAVAPYVGKQKDFGDIQRALEAIEQLYRDRGYWCPCPAQRWARGVRTNQDRCRPVGDRAGVVSRRSGEENAGNVCRGDQCERRRERSETATDCLRRRR